MSDCLNRVRKGTPVVICQPWFGSERLSKVERVTERSIFVEGKAYNRRTGKRNFNDMIRKAAI